MASFSFNSVPDSISVVQLFICVSQSIPAFPVQNCQCNESCAPADVVTTASAMLPISERINIEKTLRAGERTATLAAYRNVLQVPLVHRFRPTLLLSAAANFIRLTRKAPR